MGNRGAIIKEVTKGSIAEETELASADRLISINGSFINDIIDYRYLIADDNLELSVVKANGEEWIIDIEKDYDEDLGIIFEDNTFGGLRNCANKCVFCFVDQMPPGMRSTLYVKDDDYRQSFLQGNFISLTNLSKSEIKRIVDLHLSPLFISVHTTNPQLREKMLGNKKAGQVLDIMKTFNKAGIEMHAQIVLCPGINDGDELKRTIEELYELRPQVLSLAVVPVGLTNHRRELYSLNNFNSIEAAKVVNLINQYQNKFQKIDNDPFVYASDEFYLLAGIDLPKSELYGDYPQIENGVGIARKFLDSFKAEEKKLPQELTSKRKVTLATGVSGALVMKAVVKRLNQIDNLEVNMKVIRNCFFGETVTVTGLLTGSDIYSQLKAEELGNALIIPSVMLKKDSNLFLDNMNTDQLAKQLNTDILVVDAEQSAIEFIRKVTGGA